MESGEHITGFFSFLKHLLRRKRLRPVTLTTEDERQIRKISFLWRIGVTTSNLKSFGTVRVNGRDIEARSKNSTFIKKGTVIRVVGVEYSNLVVEPLSGCPLFWML